jgi:hypothetical protein
VPRALIPALASLLVAAADARADPPPLTWEAPTGCPEAQVVEAHVREVVGARAAAAVTAVHARAEPRGDMWQLVVVFTRRDGTTERRLTLHDCESTARATALLVAIALVDAAPAEPIDELPTAVPVEPRPLEVPPDTPRSEPPPPRASPPVAPLPPAPRVRALVQLGPAVTLGLLPRTAAGLHLAIGAAWPRLRLALAYTGWYRSPVRSARDPSLGADLSLHAASLRVGPVRRFGPIELQAGLGLEFGALRAAGFGSDVNFDRRTWWGATLVGGAIAWLPPALRRRAALLLHADLVAPLHRPTLSIDGQPFFRPAALGLRVAAQLEVRLF